MHGFSTGSNSYTRFCLLYKDEFNRHFIRTDNDNNNSRFPTVYLRKHHMNTAINKIIPLKAPNNNMWGINPENIKNTPEPIIIFQSPLFMKARQ